ncbi:CapA family protein [Undibacterium sp. CY7W]|uniref:CapA family protein n=2 Tax=Undibacterium rugosum TaxID=2762291 RepID=A0A923I2F8_9BURK|nr:CapA family protein [Undibacterium rugosum]MBR7779811.1 CapA family protein [Undibacterium rugosum]
MRAIHITFLVTAILLSSTVSAAENEAKVSLLFAGDVVLDGQPGKWIARGKDPFSAFAAIFASTDIRIANLECVVAKEGQAADKNFTFRAEPESLSVLKRHVDAVSIANNHSGDFGRAAFSEMLTHLQTNQIQYFGGGNNLSEAHRPLIIERKGLRIALLGYNEFMPRSFEAGAASAGIAWSEDEQLLLDIQQARNAYKADLVIPFMHWGWENELHSNQRQQLLAKKMIDAGADAVIGGHPHVLQETAVYKGKPIIYSIGNFMIDALDNDAQTLGWVIRLELDKQGVTVWDSRIAKISNDGIPEPQARQSSACWVRGDKQSRLCSNADSMFSPAQIRHAGASPKAAAN